MAISLLQVHGNPVLPKCWISRPNRPPVHFRPMATVALRNRSYWASINADIEEYLRRVIPPARQPPAVYEPLDHFVFSAPRNSAPALCIAACELVGGRRDQAMAAASALQLIYAAVYTREYPPLTGSSRAAVDGGAYGPNVQLLTGVGISPIGFELLAGSDDGESESGSQRIRRVMVEMARAYGTGGWIGGQFRGLAGGSGDTTVVKEVSEKTEGGLHACGGACGAILGGGSEEEIEKLRKYGQFVGMVKGLSKNVFGRKENERKRKKIEEFKALALKELESFEEQKVHEICGFLDFEGL